MKREYWFILLAYTIMQLSGFIGIPIVSLAGLALGKSIDEMAILATVIWIILSFTVTLIVTLYLLRKELKPSYDKNQASLETSILWAIGGVFLALFSQVVAANIEIMLGIETDSENTQQIIGLIELYPLVILISSIFGPILEEIVFRKILFGSLYKRLNFLLAALISSVIFALAHGEPQHIILYSAMGFVFSYLYVKTKRVIVPIFAHVSMNTFVVLTQSVFKEEIEELLRKLETTQSFIGGFFL